MKRQFNKKRRNPQGLKAGDNIWLEAKNIHSNRLSKKLDQKRYGLFRISKNIGQEMFQLEFLEGQMIHNVFNKDLLTKYKEPQFKSQHMEPTLPLNIVNKEKNTKLKKLGITENKEVVCNSQCIGRDTAINMINGYLKQGCHMLKR